ncbi:ABC transporter substrate-binding protein [Starkeya sp. ORNL1]|uniref:ABC transporter substrate-binding protein n=1 Tax=Starkeya sp. ORNL1 TaxID=2709380 RepID=UPI0014634597|nr:ABC transporter substrate-binding protein [Starkeya sp. ORNL1]QJP13128.1 ABC transporter substrate-binding protein [Starkeya sp. ORNL1]
MRRRDFIASMVGVVAWAGPARAQPSAMPVIGYLGSENPERYASRLAAFAEGLAETGYVEGRNVAIQFQWADGQYRQLPALAAELVKRAVTVIVAPGGAEVALAAKSATSDIPIVFELGGDPVALGLVTSLSRPDGNMTGVTSLSVEVSRKRLEFMSELFPEAKRFAIAANPTSPTVNSQLTNLHAAAATLGLQLRVLNASKSDEFEGMFASVRDMEAAGLVFTSDPYFANRSRRLAELAAQHAVPAITQSRDFPVAGGLMSYGGDFQQSHRHTGIYAGRILKGEKPADLPVQRVTKVEFFINLKAAQSLGLTVPPSLLSSADVVIE